MSKELSFECADYYQLFDLLIDAAGKEWLESPTIMLDGKRRSDVAPVVRTVFPLR